MIPGRTALTRMPSAATSRARPSGRCRSHLGRGVVDVLAGRAQPGRRRREVDDRAAPAAVARAHAPHRLARAEHRADHVDAEHARQAFRCSSVDPRGDVDDTGVVDERGERSEPVVDGAKEAQHLGLLRHVGGHRDRAPAERAHLGPRRTRPPGRRGRSSPPRRSRAARTAARRRLPMPRLPPVTRTIGGLNRIHHRIAWRPRGRSPRVGRIRPDAHAARRRENHGLSAPSRPPGPLFRRSDMNLSGRPAGAHPRRVPGVPGAAKCRLPGRP